jgi:hypothetical protein
MSVAAPKTKLIKVPKVKSSETISATPKAASTLPKKLPKTKAVKSSSNVASSDTSPKSYISGPKGGCYYMSGKNKVYVDRGKCNK